MSSLQGLRRVAPGRDIRRSPGGCACWSRPPPWTPRTSPGPGAAPRRGSCPAASSCSRSPGGGPRASSGGAGGEARVTLAAGPGTFGRAIPNAMRPVPLRACVVGRVGTQEGGTPRACSGRTWISFRSLSHRFCRGSMKFCLTSMSRESLTSARHFIDSPASSRASPVEEEG